MSRKCIKFLNVYALLSQDRILLVCNSKSLLEDCLEVNFIKPSTEYFRVLCKPNNRKGAQNKSQEMHFMGIALVRQGKNCLVHKKLFSLNSSIISLSLF